MDHLDDDHKFLLDVENSLKETAPEPSSPAPRQRRRSFTSSVNRIFFPSRRRAGGYLFAITIVILLSFSTHTWYTRTSQEFYTQEFQSTETYTLDALPPPLDYPPVNIPVPTIPDPTLGHWIPSEARRVDAVAWNAPESCSADLSAGDVTPEEAARLTQQRNSDVAAWEWVLEDGSALLEWNVIEFVKRGLESRIGWVVVGDSLAVQSLVAIERLVYTSGIPILIPTPVITDDGPHGYVNASTATLYDGNPLYQSLIDEMPHIPRERFDRPILWTYRSDHLVTTDELDMIMASNKVGMAEPLGPQHRSESNWVESLAEMRHFAGWDGEKEAIVQINTGPHWSPLHMQPATDAQLIDAYDAAVQMIFDKLLYLPNTLPMRVLFRSTAPAHQMCQTHSNPISLTDKVALDPSPDIHPFGWHLFPVHNAHARSVFDIPASKQNGHLRIEYWDIWDMSVQRPDAHHGWHGNQFDCLHWCHPSVPEWWIRVLWHRVMTT